MAANVESMFYTRKAPWHGLGVRVEEAPESKEALIQAGLDWKVEQTDVYAASGERIPGYKYKMTFQLVCIEPKELTQYKADMQEAFQKGFEDAFGKTDAVILPEKDIDQSLNAEGSAVYKAVVDGEMVGGAVVIINESTQHNHLDLLFVKNGVQSNGIGKKIWFELERIYPNTKVWETCTPYFDKRNIHFYVNVCGFHITEFFNEKHPMPDTPDDFVGDGNEGMFAFMKQMRL